MAAIRVLLAEDNAFVRESLTDLLSADGLEVVGALPDGTDVVTTAERTGPDVVLLDVGMLPVDGLEATRRLLAVRSGARVLLLTGALSNSAVTEARRLGARGYILKADDPQRLLEAIRTVAAGGSAWFLDILSSTGEPAHPEPGTHDMA